LCGHALRATAATKALAHNADIAKVQAWLGHAKLETTQVYAESSTEMMRESSQRALSR
jgi:site-specific recombinase XerD